MLLGSWERRLRAEKRRREVDSNAERQQAGEAAREKETERAD